MFVPSCFGNMIIFSIKVTQQDAFFAPSAVMVWVPSAFCSITLSRRSTSTTLRAGNARARAQQVLALPQQQRQLARPPACSAGPVGERWVLTWPMAARRR
jgi:hypothetical protein